jgi:carboxylesterase type B
LPTIDLGYSTVRASAVGQNEAGKYYLFSNVRYEAAPIGELRFAAPLDPLVEEGVNSGVVGTNGTEGCMVEEDCLFLDVWVPERALTTPVLYGVKGRRNDGLPVLFWNYGGGWVGGSKRQSPEVSKHSLIRSDRCRGRLTWLMLRRACCRRLTMELSSSHTTIA